ncbi:MAG: GtrA family protein [Bacteroidota bacterium]
MEKLWQFIREKIPFALTGLVATGINYGMYLLLVDRYLPPGPATLIAYSSSVILNFFLQRYFVFQLNRSLRSAFVLSMMASAFGLVLDWLIVTGLHQFPLVGDQEWIIKLVATFIVFFYNFYAKRRVFEGKRNKGARPQVLDELALREQGKGELEAELRSEHSSPMDLSE